MNLNDELFEIIETINDKQEALPLLKHGLTDKEFETVKKIRKLLSSTTTILKDIYNQI